MCSICSGCSENPLCLEFSERGILGVFSSVMCSEPRTLLGSSGPAKLKLPCFSKSLNFGLLDFIFGDDVDFIFGDYWGGGWGVGWLDETDGPGCQKWEMSPEHLENLSFSTLAKWSPSSANAKSIRIIICTNLLESAGPLGPPGCEALP